MTTEHESTTTQQLASILGAVPAGVWDKVRAEADRRAAADRERRRNSKPAPTPNPWGIRSVPTRASLLQIVGNRGVPGALTVEAASRVRKVLLAIRRSPGLHASGAVPHDALEMLNREIRGYGVETIELRTGAVVSYVNLGDTYATTLLLIRQGARWRFKVGSWGDLVEKAG